MAAIETVGVSIMGGVLSVSVTFGMQVLEVQRVGIKMAGLRNVQVMMGGMRLLITGQELVGHLTIEEVLEVWKQLVKMNKVSTHISKSGVLRKEAELEKEPIELAGMSLHMMMAGVSIHTMIDGASIRMLIDGVSTQESVQEQALEAQMLFREMGVDMMMDGVGAPEVVREKRVCIESDQVHVHMMMRGVPTIGWVEHLTLEMGLSREGVIGKMGGVQAL
jgi:hypothetical protein